MKRQLLKLRTIGLTGGLLGTVLIGHGLALKMFSTTNTTSQIYTVGTPVFLALTQDGATEYRFKTLRPTQVFFWYNAECTARSGAFTDRWVNVDILVDGIPISPSHDDNALCTSNGNNSLDQWVSASTNGSVRLNRGEHIVQVRAQLMGFSVGDSFRIDDTILQVLIEKK